MAPQPHPALVVLDEVFTAARLDLQNAERLAHQAYVKKVHGTLQRTIHEYTGNVTAEGRANLDRFERCFKYLFTKCGVKMGFLQQQIIDIGRLILLKRMFGDGIATELKYLRERFNIKHLFEQAAVTLPRRAGKTVAQTLLATVVAVTQPDGNVCNFNLLGRQAVSWLGKVLGWLKLLEKAPEFGFTYERINSQEFVVIRNCTGTLATISSYPGPRDEDASNFRGMGDKLMLLMYDEFYFLREIVYPTTLPLSINGAGILMVSSMSKTGNSAVRNMIYQKMEDGKTDFFLKLDWLRACPECVRAGKANECTHIEQRPQHFQPKGSVRSSGHSLRCLHKCHLKRPARVPVGRPRTLRNSATSAKQEWSAFCAAPIACLLYFSFLSFRM